jgi:hypothetical protein
MAENAARRALDQMDHYSRTTSMYHGLALEGILHAVAEMNETIQVMAARETADRAKYEAQTAAGPTREALLAFARSVIACEPGEDDDPSSTDQEYLTGLAEDARRLLAGQPTVYDQADATIGMPAGITCAGCGEDSGTRGHLMEKPVRGEFAYLCARCFTVTSGLLSRVKQIEHSDGSWPGGDTVELLCEWFTGLGFDIDAPQTEDDDDQDDDDD